MFLLSRISFAVTSEWMQSKNNKHVTYIPNNKLPFMKSERYVIHSKVCTTPYCLAYINNVSLLGHK